LSWAWVRFLALNATIHIILLLEKPMLRPLALAISLRYTRAKKRSYFVSFISLVSMIGIALGVMVLITVLSVMNGFDEEIHKRFFGMAPEITISDYDGKLKDWSSIEQKISQLPQVKGSAPFVGGQGLLTFQGRISPVIVTGIEPSREKKVMNLNAKLVEGSLRGFDHYGIVLGQSLAQQLGVFLGEKVTLMIPQANMTMAGMVPRFKRFTVVGIFSAGSGFNFDSKLSFIDLSNAQTLFQMKGAVSGVRVKINDVYQAPMLSQMFNELLGGSYQVGNWTQQFGAFFKAIKMEKTMMFLILMLIIAVAAFNLVSSLVMIVKDKQPEIAILRTLGATPNTILSIFLLQGAMVGLIGTTIGLILGLLLASNATEIVNWLQHLMGTNILSSNVYFVDFLPSKIEFMDVIKVCMMSFMMSFIATLYPAYSASRTQVVEALRYD
jgi:lipoprotein-releasing system permease protein